jgi:hypothetical protein
MRRARARPASAANREGAEKGFPSSGPILSNATLRLFMVLAAGAASLVSE